MAKRVAQGSGSIRKKSVIRNGKNYEYWEGRIDIPSEGKRVQRSITGQTQKKVRLKMNELLASLDKGTYRAPNKITVSAWFREWLDTFVSGKVKPYTLTGYDVIIRNHVDPALGGMRLQSVKGAHIQRMYNRMLDNGMSPKTIKNVGAVIHKCFSVAVKQGMISLNPCDNAELPAMHQHEIKPLTDADIPKFLEAIADDIMGNAYALCLFAGLREGECLGLSWSQVDFDKRQITICQQLQKDKSKGGGYYIAPFTKSNKPRTIKLAPIAVDYLRQEQRRQAANRLQAGRMWENTHNLVFTNETGGNLKIFTFYSHFKRIAASIGRPDARPHDLRHTAATVAIASGADIKSVQSMLGHATASFTLNVYAHTSEKMMEDTADRMQNYYSNLDKKA